MATKIIVLDTSRGPGGDTVVNYLFWLTPAAGREVPRPNIRSAWRDAQPADNAALQAGTIVEEAYSTQLPVGFSQGQVASDLAAKYTARSAAFAAALSPNLYYGSTWDGTTWTLVTHP